MLATMPGRMLTAWQVFYGLELRGEERADWRAGMVASVIANVNRAEGSDPLGPGDFMPKWAVAEPAEADEEEAEAPAQSEEAMLAMMARLAALTGTQEQLRPSLPPQGGELESPLGEGRSAPTLALPR